MTIRGLVLLTIAVTILFAALHRLLTSPVRPQDGVPAGPVTAERERIVEFWSLYRAASAHRLAGRVEAALESYTLALERNPGHQDALYYLGSMQLELGDFAGAERSWHRLVAIDSASGRAHMRLGALYLCQDSGAPYDAARAEAEFARAHAINREETGPVLQLGEAAMLRGDFASARRHFRAVLGSHGSSVPALFYLGYLEWASGDTAGARAAFASAVRAAPPPARREASGEGDTRKGLTPMLAAASRCAGLRELTLGLAGSDPTGASSDMSRRYRLLDRLRAQGRERATTLVR